MQRHDRHDDRAPLPGAGYAEDYTAPFLWIAGVLTFVALFALWVAWGIGAALLAGFAANRAIPRR